MPHSTRSVVVDEVIAGYEALMHRLADSHAPEFLEIAITMSQAKLLYLVALSGELPMSTLVQRLGVSLSTVSGLVDKVVDQGLATRREDPADRRHVIVGLTPEGTAFIDRFRELNARQMRELLEALEDGELEEVRDAVGHLARAAARINPSPTTHASGTAVAGAVTRKDHA